MPKEFKELFTKAIAPNENYPLFCKLLQAIDVLNQQGIRSSNDLVELLHNRKTDFELRDNLISILGIIKYKPSIPVLFEIARDEQAELSLKRGSLVYLASLSSKDAYSVLSELISHNPVDDIRIMAATLSFYVPTKACLNLLLKTMRNDKNEIVRSQAVRSIGLMNRPDKAIAIQPLRTTLDNQHEAPIVRAYAAEALGFIRDEGAVDLLIRFTADSSPNVRYMCAYSLGEIGNANHLELLESLLADNTVFDDWGTVGDAAKEAIQNLTRVCPI